MWSSGKGSLYLHMLRCNASLSTRANSNPNSQDKATFWICSPHPVVTVAPFTNSACLVYHHLYAHLCGITWLGIGDWCDALSLVQYSAIEARIPRKGTSPNEAGEIQVDQRSFQIPQEPWSRIWAIIKITAIDMPCSSQVVKLLLIWELAPAMSTTSPKQNSKVSPKRGRCVGLLQYICQLITFKS